MREVAEGVPRTEFVSEDSQAAILPGSKKNYEIESFRALAIAMVLFQHSFNYLTFWIPPWAQTFGAFFSFGQAGVDLFFAVSGYVIAGSLLPSLVSASSHIVAWKVILAFWIKRIFRLWPTVVVWVCVDLILAFFFNQSGAFGSSKQTVIDAVAAVAQVANVHQASCGQPNVCFTSPVFSLGPLWSLSLEEQFYFVFPILVFALLIIRRLGLLLPILAGIAIAQIFLFRPDGALLLYLRTDALCGGIIVYLVSSWPGIRLLRTPILAAGKPIKFVTKALLFSILLLTTGRVVSFNAGISAAVATCLVMIAHYEAGWFSFSSNPILNWIVTWMAERSYSIYVTHCICIALTREIWWRIMQGRLPEQHTTLKFYASWIVLVILFSELNWRFVEAPLRQEGRRSATRILSLT
jgi:peptidoglycan/LPS O-acetylase OafA/YrhL